MMGGRTWTRRLPLHRLCTFTHTHSHAELAALVGVSEKAVARWARDGVPERSADQAAVNLGLHPAIIWPEWDDMVRTAEDRA